MLYCIDNYERNTEVKNYNKSRKTLNGTARMQVVWGLVFHPLCYRTTAEIATRKVYQLWKLCMKEEKLFYFVNRNNKQWPKFWGICWCSQANSVNPLVSNVSPHSLFEYGQWHTSRSESGGGEGLLFLLPRPRDFPSEPRRRRSESESLMGVEGLWIVLYSVKT